MFRRLIVAFVLVSVAPALMPPIGNSAPTPHLQAKNIVLRVTDFAEGTTVTLEENSPSSVLRGIPAASAYTEVVSVPGLGGLANSAIVTRTARGATTFVREVSAAVATPTSRAEWAKSLLNNFDRAGFPATSARILRHRRLKAGDGAAEIVAQLSVGNAKVFLSELFVSEGPAVESLTLTAVSPITPGEMTHLAKLIADRVRAAAQPPPDNTASPSIRGTIQLGQILTATPGRWSGKEIAFAFQWLRCDQTGARCVSIPDATNSIYTVSSSDEGSTLVVAVQATDAAGTGRAISLATPVVP